MDLSYIKPPEEPKVQDVSTTASGPVEIQDPFVTGLYKFVADEDCWIKFGDSSVANPVISATSGTGRCWKLTGGQEYLLCLGRSHTHLNVITDSDVASTYLRWFLEQGTG
jgi:hypothetical protein